MIDIFMNGRPEKQMFSPLPASLREHPLRDIMLFAIRSAMEAIDPARCVENNLRLKGDTLFIGPHQIDISNLDRIRVSGGGKAGLPMARAVQSVLGDKIETGVLVVKTKESGREFPTGEIEILEADHPIPSQASLNAARAVLGVASNLKENDLLLVLLSGGVSSLMTLPVQGLTLHDLQSVTRHLLLSGADIESLNIVRKHLSAIKGGLLARAAAPARVFSLILSDVPGDSVEAIGSGPTAPDSSTFQDALERLVHFKVADKVPGQVISHFKQGIQKEIRETPKPDDPIFSQVFNMIIGGNRQAREAAVSSFQDTGLTARLASTPLTGEARSAGALVAEEIRNFRERAVKKGPACLVFGGETTVTVRGAGKGGRNLETALSAAIALDGLPNITLVALATDGQDGPTDAAGAAVTDRTLARAREAGLSPVKFLEQNNTYEFFQKLDDLLFTGATHTNAADLLFAFFETGVCN